MLSVRCAVPACSNDRTKNGDKTFLPAPKQKSVRDEWFKVLGVPDTVEDAFICEDHFEVDDKSEGGYESGDGCSVSASDTEVEPAPEPTNLKRKSVVESTLPFKKKMLSEHRNSNHHKAPDEIVQACYSNRSSSPSTPASIASDSQERSENSESSWSVKEGPLIVNDNSNGSGVLVIKSEPEDDGYEQVSEHPGGHDYIMPEGLGTIKIEASMGLLHEEKSKPLPVGNDRINDYQPPVLSPFLEILDQPESSYRFRYKRESTKPHGPLKGRSSVAKTPKHSYGPRVMLRNFHGKEAAIRAWLFCENQVSPHQLVAPPDRGRTELKYEPHVIHVTSEHSYAASFDKLNILHVVCGERDYQKRYYEKKMFCMSESFYPPPKVPPINFNAVKDEVKRIEKDIARIYFEAFEKTESGFRKICDVFSEDIKNKKSPKTNDLKILRQSHEEGSCRGNQQVFIFTEKLIKDVNVEFFEEDVDGEITWSSKASFKETDIHKQVAISFWTPPYKDLHIKTPVPVFFRLVRKTDGAHSHNRTYRYLPADCPCKSPGRTLPDAPPDVYIRWPRRRECTSPEKLLLVKDAGIQTTTLIEDTKFVKKYVPLKPIFIPSRQSNSQQQLKAVNPQPKPRVYSHPTAFRMVCPRVNPEPGVAKTDSEPLVPPKSMVSVNRTLLQLSGNVFKCEGKNFIKLQIPAANAFSGIPIPPEPSGAPLQLMIPQQTQPEPEKP